MSEIQKTAQKIMTKGKGILASDERPTSANKNLIKAGITIPTTIHAQEELRRNYRQLFIKTPGIEKYLSGMILQEETFYQSDDDGYAFRDTLIEKDILVIIKVDGGTVDIPGFPGEKMTLGIDGLDDRLAKYYKDGARLAKWRSVISIGEFLPTDEAIEANIVGLAEYASFCQKNKIVPIVEPEILLDGDHSIERCESVTKDVLKRLFDKLIEYKVDLSAVILKASMVLPGKQCPHKASHGKIAKATVRALKHSVPHEVSGIVFLSGGQSSEDAIENFNDIAELEPLPWEIAFSYLRAIEGPATKAWAGKEENVDEARNVFLSTLETLKKADAGKL
jgi:fructose-bisphosphate aldolase class I